jgi:hypothetical protein
MTDWSTYVPSAHEIETYSGRYLNLACPEADVITLEDVAHGLAFTCRYNGQCAFYYSVAQHAVMVSRYLEKQGESVQVQLCGLHHDDAEAFLGDVTRPLKSLLQPVYGVLSDRMDAAIAAAFGNLWPVEMPSVVKDADNWALSVEARRLLPSKGRHWVLGMFDEPGIERGADSLGLWTGRIHEDPTKAANAFIRRHNTLLLSCVRPPT